MKINIVGDFKCNNVSNISFDTSLLMLLKDGDINIVNFEAPIKNSNSKKILKSGPNLSQSKESAIFLEQNGFNLVSLANNHVMDYGEEALKNTMACFKKATTIGAGTWEEAYKIKSFEVEHKRFGFLALTQHEFGVLAEKTGNEHCIGSAWMLHPMVDELILKGKKENDYLFILPHAGIENQYQPLPELRTLYKHWINMGADGVIASHPHTPQGWETYNGKPIVYSLGNFCFKNHSAKLPPYWFYGLIANIEINEEKIDLDIHGLHYDINTGLISVTKEDSFCSHLSTINKVLQDEPQYLKDVERYCKELMPVYDRAFAESGYAKYDSKKYIKLLLKKMFWQQRPTNMMHLMNNLRCEVHRWAIARAINHSN